MLLSHCFERPLAFHKQMTIIARPVESESSTILESGYYSACGGSLPMRQSSSTIQSYILSDYVEYGMTGLPLPFLPYYHTKSVTEFQNDFYRRDGGPPNPNYKANMKNCFGGAGAPTPPYSISELTDAASKNFYSNMSKHNSINIAVAFAEMAESIGTVASLATRLGLAFRHLRRGRVRDAFSMLGIENTKRLSANDIRLAGLPITKRKGGWSAEYHRKHLESMVPKSKYKLKRFAANTWLEIQYGWKPIVYDVYGLAQFIAERQYKSTWDVSVSGTAVETGSFTSSDSNVVANASYTAVVKYVSRLKVTSPELQMQASLGLTNPALVVWELVPFSFIVDWFIPIGDSLQQLSALHGYTEVDGCKTVFTKYSSDAVSINPEFPCSSTTESFSMSRTLGGTPAITWPSFDLKKALSVSHFTTALSLLVSAFHK